MGKTGAEAEGELYSTKIMEDENWRLQCRIHKLEHDLRQAHWLILIVSGIVVLLAIGVIYHRQYTPRLEVHLDNPSISYVDKNVFGETRHRYTWKTSGTEGPGWYGEYGDKLPSALEARLLQ